MYRTLLRARHIWLTALFFLTLGCSRLPQRAELVFINGAEPEVLDPALISAQPTSRIANAIFEGLTIFSETATILPGVAERWDISADGKIYTFHLRNNATWTNGDPVTSEDFRYAWTRALRPETGCEYASQLYPIQNAKPFNEGKINDASTLGISTPNPLTLQVTLENPTPYFLDLCAFSTYLPVHRPTVESHPDWATQTAHFVGNGPFLFKEWRLFDRVRLEKNPRYWNAQSIPLQSIDVLPASRPTTAFNLYATGQVDLMMDKGLAPTALIDELRKRPDFHSGPFLGNYFIRFNITRPHLANPKVRQALALAFDKERITTKITRAGETPAHSFVPPNTGRSYQPPTAPKRDLDKARELLAEAGYPNGKGLPVLTYLFRGESDIDRDIAVEIQRTLEEQLGIKLLLRGLEWTVYLSNLSNLDYDLCRSSWVADYNDPNTFLNMFVTGDGNNRTGWSRKDYDQLIDQAAAEADPEKRFSLFHQAERILVDTDPPICPLFYWVGIQFYDATRLAGITPNLLDEHPLRFIHWKRQ